MYASNAFVTFCVTKCTHQMHFCTAEHFPLQKCIFAPVKCTLNIFLWKMYAKRHFCIKYIFAANAFVTFCVTKCDALLCKNVFDAKESKAKERKAKESKGKQRKAKQSKAKQSKTSNTFVTFCATKCDAKIYLMQKCLFAYIFQRKMFSCAFVRCVAKMHFCIKCICNILCYKMYASNAFDAKMLCFLLCKKQRCCPYILLVLNIFLWKM